MAEDTSKLLPGKASEGQAAPTLEPKDEDQTENVSHEAPLQKDLNNPASSPESAGSHTSQPEEKKQVIPPPPKKIILMDRIQLGKYKAVFRVIKEGKLPANLLLEPQNKWYLIHYLVMHGKLKELKVLVTKFDCDINILDAYQQTPLHMAALHGKTEIFKYLVHNPMIRLDTQDSFRSTPLVNTVKSGFVAGFIYLYFEKGADIKVVDTQGFTVVHWAVFKNSIQLLQLLKHIPTLVMDTTDSDGMTPIFRAIAGIAYDSVKYLIRAEKVNLEAKSTRRQTPCEYAESMPMHPKVLAYVRKHTELQKVSKRGPVKYLKEGGFFKGIYTVIKYLLKSYGKSLSIATNVLLMMFMLITFWNMGPMGKLANGLFSTFYLIYVSLFILLLCKKDPGYQPMKGMEHPTNAVAQILESLRENTLPNCDNFCFSCLIEQTRSTHHCLTCGRCVNGFQFHLKPWQFGMCIGSANFPVYFLYELFGVLCWYEYICAILNSALPIATAGFPVSIVEKWLELLPKHFFLAILIVILLLISVQKIYELLIMFTGICKGMTVHELRNMHLYKYLFDLKDLGDQGKRYVHKKRSWSECINNISVFFCQTWSALRGLNEIAQQPQFIQLAETAVQKGEQAVVPAVPEAK